MKTFWKKLFLFIKELLLQYIVGSFVFFIFWSIMLLGGITDYTVMTWDEVFAFIIIFFPLTGIPLYIGNKLITTIWVKKYGTNGIGYLILAYIFVTYAYVFKFLGYLIPFCNNILLVSIFTSFIISILLVLVRNKR
jgi:hypothetical protein